MQKDTIHSHNPSSKLNSIPSTQLKSDAKLRNAKKIQKRTGQKNPKKVK